MSAPPTEKAPLDVDKAFGYLTGALNRIGADAHMKIGAHIRAITNGKINSLGVYHATPNIAVEQKLATYKLCFNCLVKKGGPDWTVLQGQVHKGDAKPADEPKQPVKVSVDKRSGRAKAERIDPLEAVPEAEEPEPVPTPRPRSEPPPRIEVSADADPLTRAIIATVQQHLRVTAGVDEKQVEEIADRIARAALSEHMTDFDQAFKDKLSKAMENGAFPAGRVQSMLDELEKKVVELIENNRGNRVFIAKLDGSVKELEGRQHYKFALLIAALSQRLNVALVGPAGSSKTTAANHAAKALDLEFEAISVGPMTSKSDLLGFVDAHGKYHGTATVRRAEKGGIMLWDEFDAANASVATYGNMLLANEAFGTADGMKVKHKDFCLIAGLNTYGMGANRVYVGRNQLDGATLDRFVVVDWDYDEGLEAAIVGCNRLSPVFRQDEGGILEPDAWLTYVIDVRRACEKLAIRHVVSPRATIHGVKLFHAGVGRTHVEQMVLWKGLDKATVDKIKAAL